MANLGNVAIKPSGEWIIGVVYKPLNAVTHNGNLYLALKENAVEPTNDMVNWWMILEGVPIATTENTGQSKPDGKTITIDADGTLHGASQVPEGVTYVDLDGEGGDTLPVKLPINADLLEGHSAEYFAAKTDVPEAWDYNVQNPNKITLRDKNGEIVGEIIPHENKDNGFDITGLTVQIAQFIENNLHIKTQFFADGGAKVAGVLQSPNLIGTKGKIFVDGENPISIDIFNGTDWINIGYVNSSAILNLLYGTLIKTYVDFSNGARLNFNTTEGKTKYRFICQNDNILVLQTIVGGSYVNSLIIDQNGEITLPSYTNIHHNMQFNNGCTIVWLDDRLATQLYRIYCTGDNLMHHQYKDTNGSWQNAFTMGRDGVVHFYKDISAPNIASVTALMETEQQLTEQDLTTIELQQKVAALEAQVAALTGGDASGQTDY